MKAQRCRFCGAQVGGELEETLEALLSCTNCIADIAMRGSWTGIGVTILDDLKRRYGAEAILEAEKRIKGQ